MSILEVFYEIFSSICLFYDYSCNEYICSINSTFE